MVSSLTIIITAHPDDEAMFFLPTIRAVQQHSRVWLLCLTTGDFDGLGETRKLELEAVAEVLQLDKLLIIDDDAIPDHMTLRWDTDYTKRVIAKKLQEAMLTEKLSLAVEPAEYNDIQVITFDSRGVSGHPNHVDTNLAVRQYCDEHSYPLYCLLTVENPCIKYIPIVEWLLMFHVWLLSLLCMAGCWTETPHSVSNTLRRGSTVVHRLSNPSYNWQCMALHASQFVWYRRLFVIFSCYTFVNRLELAMANDEPRKKSS